MCENIRACLDPLFKRLRLDWFYSNLSKCRTRINEVQSTYTTLVHKHEQQTIKVKHKSKGREMQIQDNTKTCYQKEIEELGEKPLHCPPSCNWSTRE